MGIKSADNNWFEGYKWFGCFLKDTNAVDNHTAWSYDIKQLPVTVSGHLDMPSSLGAIRVVTNPYATSAAAVAAVSGVFKYHTHYDDGETSALRATKVTMYAEASAMTSSVASTKYFHFPYVPSGDWLHYAKGKTNYGLAGSSIFEGWHYEAEEVYADSKRLNTFSSTLAQPHLLMASGKSDSSGSNHGVNWVDNYPRGKVSSSQGAAPGGYECKCCHGWSLHLSNGANISVKTNEEGSYLHLNAHLRVAAADKTGCGAEPLAAINTYLKRGEQPDHLRATLGANSTSPSPTAFAGGFGGMGLSTNHRGISEVQDTSDSPSFDIQMAIIHSECREEDGECDKDYVSYATPQTNPGTSPPPSMLCFGFLHKYTFRVGLYDTGSTTMGARLTEPQKMQGLRKDLKLESGHGVSDSEGDCRKAIENSDDAQSKIADLCTTLVNAKLAANPNLIDIYFKCP